MSVCDTIKERHQFSFYKRNKIAKNLPKKFLQKYKIAVTMRPVVESCTEFFHHKRIRPGWSRGRKGKQISNQIYYC